MEGRRANPRDGYASTATGRATSWILHPPSELAARRRRGAARCARWMDHNRCSLRWRRSAAQPSSDAVPWSCSGWRRSDRGGRAMSRRSVPAGAPGAEVCPDVPVRPRMQIVESSPAPLVRVVVPVWAADSDIPGHPFTRRHPASRVRDRVGRRWPVPRGERPTKHARRPRWSSPRVA